MPKSRCLAVLWLTWHCCCYCCCALLLAPRVRALLHKAWLIGVDMLILGLRGLAVAKKSRPKSWQTGLQYINKMNLLLLLSEYLKIQASPPVLNPQRWINPTSDKNAKLYKCCKVLLLLRYSTTLLPCSIKNCTPKMLHTLSIVLSGRRRLWLVVT